MKKLLVAMIVGSLLALPLSAMAMEKITGSDLDNVTGQAGITVGFGSDVVTEISFSALSWGDPDGYSTASDSGWLIIDGDIGITTNISQGGTLAIDVGNTGTTSASFNGVTIPSGKSFLALSLPGMDVNVTVPDTLAIGFGTQAGTMVCTMGLLNLDGLAVSVGSISALYVWCH